VWMKKHPIPKNIQVLLDIFKWKKRSLQIFHLKKNGPTVSLLTEKEWTPEQRAFVKDHVFTTYDRNNYLHQLHIASAPSVYLLDVQQDKEVIAFNPPSNAHIIIRIQHNQPVTIIERRTNNTSVFSGIEIFLRTGIVHYLYTQPQHIKNKLMLRHAKMSEQTTINWHIHLLGGNNTYHEVQTEGSNFISNLYGTYITSKKEHSYMNYEVIHTGFPGGKSNISVHGIGIDQSYSNFQGNISIKQKGAKTEARLEEHCLLFSPSAKHDTMPTLQIDTNDVVASHSASTTQIDEDYLFYMGTRGLGDELAKKMIVQGFLAHIYSHIPIEKEKKAIQHYIDNLEIHV
jgi:Fe-S cluster assembly protein SufD